MAFGLKFGLVSDLVFLTICVEDVTDQEIKVESDSLYFKGTGGPDKKTHEVHMKFLKEIDTEVLQILKRKPMGS